MNHMRHVMKGVIVEVLTESDVYVPGQTMRGTVNISTSNPIQLDSITARLFGDACVSFTSKEHYTFVNRQQYVDETSELWRYSTINHMLDMKVDENSNKENVHRLTGRASYPFIFQLPANAATSFHCIGSPVTIRYFIEVSLRLGDYVIFVHDHPIMVLAPETIPRSIASEQSLHSKQFHFPKERSILVECVLDRSVFKTADRVDARLTITNRWKQSIKYVHMSIVRRIVAEGKLVGDRSIHDTNAVNIDTTGVGLPSERPKISVGESYSFRPSFNVPALPPSMKLTGIMEATYLLKIAIGRAHNFVVANLQIPISIVTDFEDAPRTPPPPYEEILVDVTPTAPVRSYSTPVDLLA